MAAFTESQELQDLGKHLIEQNFPTLGILKIGFLFRDKSRKIQGRLVPGDARKSSDRDWSLHSKDFVIEVAEDVWQEATNEFRLAIMDHLLARVGIDEDDPRALFAGHPEGNPPGLLAAGRELCHAFGEFFQERALGPAARPVEALRQVEGL